MTDVITYPDKSYDYAGNAPRTLKREEWPPDYTAIMVWRLKMVELWEKNPAVFKSAMALYADDPKAFINDWCITYDPRNSMDDDALTTMPLILFQRQADFVDFLYQCMKDNANGAVDKSRTMGATWVSCAFSVWLWLFIPGAAVGWGSRKEELVDRIGDPKTIFDKMRRIIEGLPKIMWPANFTMRACVSYMKIINPATDASIAGEGGDNIGRGGRTSIYFKDESAHYEHPESIEAALGENTRCQIDISTHNGIGTVFDRKVQAGVIWTPGEKIPRGRTRVIVLDWHDHPEMTQQWHDEREAEYRSNGLLHIFKQEVDRDPAASLFGVIIPNEWVRSAIDAHKKLPKIFKGGGMWMGSYDPADEGGDLHAYTERQGVILKKADEWGEGDPGQGTRRIIGEVQNKKPLYIQYDAIGIGSAVKSEVNRLYEDKAANISGITFVPWLASAKVKDPESPMEEFGHSSGKNKSKAPKNKDIFANFKAQGWWALRRRFEKTHQQVQYPEIFNYPEHELISLDSEAIGPKLDQLVRELSQAIQKKNSKLQLVVDKKPEGARSPNMADSTVQNYFPASAPLIITEEMVAHSAGRIVAPQAAVTQQEVYKPRINMGGGLNIIENAPDVNTPGNGY